MEIEYKVCKNCGDIVEKNFCPNCGQEYKEIHLSLKQLLSELFNDIFNVDSKMFKTLKTLLFKPGKLSLEYISGKKARYISPFKLYLIISVLYFVLVNFRDVSYPKMKTVYQDIKTNGIVIDSTRVIERFASKVEKPVKIDSTKTKKHPMVYIDFNNDETQFYASKYWLMIRNNLKYSLFFLLPIAALLLKLIYIRQKKKYLEHLIFAIHIHTVIFIILIMMVFVDIRILDFLVMIATITYIIRAMKKFYGQKLSKTIWKYWLVSSMYLFVTAIVISSSALILFLGISLGL